MPVKKNIQQNTFAARMNSDAADELLQPGEYRKAYNLRSKSGIASNVKGNIHIPYTFPGTETAEVKTIGRYVDAPNNRLIYFVYHSEGLHHIIEYDLEQEIIIPIFISKTNSDNVDILKFNKDYLITGVEIVNGTDLLIWCDNLNPVRCLNISEARERVGWKEDQINLYKEAPPMPPDLFYFNDTSRVNNYLHGNLIKAAYRYIYKDGLISTFSDYSKVPLPANENYRGENSISSNNNGVKIRIGTGDETVEKIEIAVQVGSRDFVSVKILDKQQEEILDNSTYDFLFYNDGNYSVLPKDDLIQPYNFLPKTPAALALINGKVLAVAGGEEGWDDVPITAETQVEYEEVDMSGTTSTVVDTPTFTATEAIRFFDRPRPAYRATQTFVVGADVSEGYAYFARGSYKSGFNWNYTATSTDTAGSVASRFRNAYLQANSYATATAVIIDSDGNASFTGTWRDKHNYRHFDVGANGTTTTVTITGSNKTIKANKSGAVVQYGIQYEDAEGRKSPTFTSDDLIVKSNFINVHTQVGNPKIKVPVHVLQISHTPPLGAVRFQLMRSRNLTYKKFVQTLTHAAYEVTNTDTGELYLDLVIDGFDAYNKLYPNSIIGYQFNPGDRVRFIRGKTNQTTNVAYTFHEAVILEQRWNAVQTIDGNVSTAAGTTQITVDTGQTNETHVGKKIRLSKSGGITIERTITGVADTTKYNIDQAIGFTDTYATYELIDVRQVIRIKKPLFNVEDKSMIEIFTPALGETSDGSKIFFEFGQKYEIVQPGTDTRAHVGSHQDQTSVLPAIFKIKEGDVYIRNREVPTNLTLLPENIQTYVEVVEDENFSDFYESDLNDNGRPSTVFTDTEAKQFGSRIRFGQQNLIHTDTNRINLFRSNDREDYEDNYGDIRLLKFKEERLLCFKEKMFGYIPVLQNIVRTADGNSLLSASSKLLNPIQYFTFNGGIGDAVDSYTEGESQWYASCPEAGTWLRFGGDGFTPISQTSMFDVASKSHFEHVRLNGAKVHAGYDRKNQEAIFAIENTPPKIFDNVFNPNSWVVATPTSVDLTSFQVITQPTKGTVTLGAGGAATYSATPGQTGTDFFTFQVNDQNGIGYPITKVCIDVVEAVSFSFVDQSGLEPSTLTMSNVTTVTGIYDDYIINVDPGAEYRVNGGTWLSGSEASILVNGDTVQLRRTTSAQYGVGVSVPVTIAGVTKSWTITVKPPILAWRAKESTGYCITRDADTTPDQFSFADVSGAEINTQYTSNAITVTGIEASTPISITAGEYEINGNGTWKTTAGTVVNGNSVKVRRTSAGTYLTAAGTTLTIGGISDTYMITTRDADSTPGVFLFQDKTGAELNTYYNSNSVTITGIDPGTSISVVGGEYSINGGDWTSTSGTINAGQTVTVRGISSSSYSTATNVTLTVGTYSDTFTITTKAPTTPQPFTFVDQSGSNLNSYIVSNSVSMSGLSGPTPMSINAGGSYPVEYSINLGPWSNKNNEQVADSPTIPPTPTTTVHLIGYAAQGSGTTGGSAGETVTATTYSELRTHCASTSPLVIKVTANIICTNYITVQSNKTIVGIGDITISGGGFYIDTKSNIIIQNLKFRNNSTADGITIRDNSHHIWVDHCDFDDDVYDGLLDITNGSDFVTVSWCKFASAGKCMLIGSTYPSTMDPGKLNVTVHHNWFVNNFERQPSARYGKIHFFNNLVEKNASATMSFSYGVGSREDCHIRAEYNAFIGITEGRPLDDLRTNGKFAGISTNYFDATSSARSNRTSNLDDSYVPPYSYSYDRAQDVPSLVRAGAGNTMGTSATGATSTTITPIPTTSTTSTSSASIIGYGASATGGASGPSVSVTTYAQLKQEAESTGAKVIRVSGTITGDGSTTTINVASDKTILGEFGSILSGVGLIVTSKSNLILRNLTFKNYVLNGGVDAVRFTGCTNIWLDHCTFDATKGDYAIDMYNGTDNVTISNCKFADCSNTIRIGNSATSANDTGKGHVTLHKNHFLNCVQKTPQVNYGYVHLLNNFFQYNVTTNQNEVLHLLNNGTARLENNYYHGLTDTILRIESTALGYQESGGVKVQCTAVDTIASGKATTVTIPYTYTAKTAEQAQQEIVATNGAGATMTDPTSSGTSVTVSNGDSIRLRILTTGTYNQAHNGTLTVHSSPVLTDTFTVTTLPQDITPDDFNFTDQTNRSISTVYESNQVTISGITNNTTITPGAGAEFKIGSGPWMAVASTINNNELLSLRQTSSASYSTAKTVSITVGSVTKNWTITTKSFDQTPSAWCFTTHLTGAELSTLYESEIRTVTGMDPGVSISISGGEYRINGGAWVTAAGTINPNSTVQVRRTSSSLYATTVSATLTIGTTSCPWNVTTKNAPDTTPDPYDWTDVTNAELNTTYISNAIILSGLTANAAISITGGGEYSINTSGTSGTWSAWASAAGSVTNGQGVRVRLQSSTQYSTATNTTTNIGGVTATFDVTTKVAPPPPPVGTAHALTIPQSGVNEACPAPRTQTRYTYDSNLVPTVSMQFYNDVNLTTAYTGSGWHGVTWGGPNNVGTKYSLNLLNGVVQSYDFCVETPPDTSPDNFTFQRKDGVELSTSYPSNSIQITGINAATNISISGNGGAYATSSDNLNWSFWKTGAETITNGTWVRLLLTSSSSYFTELSTTLTVGDKSGIYYVKTKDAPPPPPPAGVAHQLTIPSSINDVCPQPRSQTRYTSETNLAPTVGMQFYTTSAMSSIYTGTGWHGVTWGGPNNVDSKYALLLNNGLVQQVEICVDPDTQPDDYTYLNKSNVELNTFYVSDPVTITGINTATSISVLDGEYSLNGGAFTTAAGTLTNNTQVRVRLQSAGTYSTVKSASTNIGGITKAFSVTTKASSSGGGEYVYYAHVTQSGARALTVTLRNSSTYNTSAPLDPAPVDLIIPLRWTAETGEKTQNVTILAGQTSATTTGAQQADLILCVDKSSPASMSNGVAIQKVFDPVLESC